MEGLLAMAEETHAEQIARVEMMAQGDATPRAC